MTPLPDRLRLEHGHPVTITAGEDGRRELVGLAVPFLQIGRTSAGLVMFQRGAIDPGTRPPLLRDHDTARPIGVVHHLEDGPDGLIARARVSRTALGDESLELAADGALTGLSVGVEVLDGRWEAAELEDGSREVLLVTAARLRELSLVTFPAFPAAQVSQVAAALEDGPIPPTQPMEVPPVNITAETMPADDAGTIIPTTPLVAVRSERPSLTAGQVAHAMILAQRGDTRAAELVATLTDDDPRNVYAALTGETTSTSDGIVPPSYSSTILGGLPVATPFTGGLVRRTGLPASGMSIVKPLWETVPLGDWVATENTAAPTSAATIGNKSVPVLTYAHAVLASLNLVNRSDFGGYANAYYGQVGIDYLAKKEARTVAAAIAAANVVATLPSDPTGAIGALVAAQIAAQTTAGEFRGLMPEYAAVGADVWSALVETKVLDGPAFSTGSIQWGNLTGTLSGLVVALVPAMAAKAILVGARAAVALHDQSEMQLRALVVNTLNVELGVLGNCAVDVEYPEALATGTLGAPAAARTGK